MSDGVIDATAGAFKSHPFLWGGLAVGAIALVYVVSRKSTPAASSFNFSYGPSDAQVAAGTQLQIAQAADQTATTLQAAQLANSKSIAGDYFSYLATGSANNLAATESNNAVTLSALSDQQIANARSYYLTSQAQTDTIATNQTDESIARDTGNIGALQFQQVIPT